jgi:type I restriction enzyme R subunit
MTSDETEADTRAERIDPVLEAAGWGHNGSKVRREVICPGRIQSGGKRGKGLSADYVLFHSLTSRKLQC